MNRLYPLICLFVVQSANCFGQLTVVQPVVTERPTRPFSNVIPVGTAWTVTTKSRSELNAKKEQNDTGKATPPSPSAHLIVKKIDYAYAAGLRRETFHYEDRSSFTRYVTPNAVLFEERVSGDPIIDAPSDSMSGPTHGTDRLGELKWVSDKFYLGVADYNGRPCYVYRNYASQKAQTESAEPPDLNQELPEAVATAQSELKDLENSRIEATAFIDKATMRPLALETMYGVQLYDWNPGFQPFSLPVNLAQAVRDRDEAIARRKQRYLISQ